MGRRGFINKLSVCFKVLVTMQNITNIKTRLNTWQDIYFSFGNIDYNKMDNELAFDWALVGSF